MSATEKNMIGITAILGTKDTQSRVCMCVCLWGEGDIKLVLKADEEFCKMSERGRWEIYFFKRT